MSSGPLFLLVFGTRSWSRAWGSGKPPPNHTGLHYQGVVIPGLEMLNHKQGAPMLQWVVDGKSPTPVSYMVNANEYVHTYMQHAQRPGPEEANDGVIDTIWTRKEHGFEDMSSLPTDPGTHASCNHVLHRIGDNLLGIVIDRQGYRTRR